MNTFEQEIITKARSLSQDINEYFENQEYKNFTEDECQQEEITDRYLLHIALEKIFEEVQDIGIDADFNVDDFIEDGTELETLFALREKFDKANLYELLKSLSEKSFSEFRNVYESIELAEDLFLELAPWLAHLFPNDPAWFMIERAPLHWYSTQAFATHLGSVVNQLVEKTDLNKAVVNDSNINSVSKFLQVMKMRNETITIYIKEICKAYPDLNVDLLNKYVRNYDIQKLNNDQLPLFAAYNDIKPKEEPVFLKEHHLTVNHHIEYWVDHWNKFKQYKTPMPMYTREIAVMLVVSLVLDKLTSRQMLNRIKPLEDIVAKDLYVFTQELCKLDYESMLHK